jgi:hypothetical protein
MKSPASAADSRQWIENMRTAEARDRQVPLSPTESLRRSCDLMEFARRLGTSPADNDEERVRATWAKLRRAWGVP